MDPAVWLNTTIPADFPIKVDEENATVTVAAGLSQRHILDYLGAYTHWKQPDGWTLPAFSWFIDQTIGGAVATATHGSTFRWGSLSSQIRGMKVVLANGTIYELTSPEQNVHLWKALGVSVGRLGVTTEVTLRIVPAAPVTRTTHKLKFDEFVNELAMAQEAYKSAKAANDTAGMQAALYPFDGTETFWFLPTANMYRAQFQHEGKNTSTVVLNLTAPVVTAMEGPSQAPPVPNLPGVDTQEVRPGVQDSSFELDPANVQLIASLGESAIIAYLYNGTFPREKAFLSESVADTQATDVGAPFDQYEAAVPFERAADCLRQLGQAIYGPDELWKGFRTPNNIRFLSSEDFYISPANGNPTMFINFEDYIEPSGGGTNVKLERVAQMFLEGD